MTPHQSTTWRSATIGALVVAVGALLVGCGSSSQAQEIAVVRTGDLYSTNSQLNTLTPVAQGQIESAAYSRDGTLWFTRVTSSPTSVTQTCSLFRATSPAKTAWTFAQLAGATDNTSGLCNIYPAADNGLLFEASNHTAASVQVLHLNPATGAVSMIAAGMSPAVSPDGKTIALLQRNYNPAPPYGAYEVLSVGPMSAVLPVAVKQVTRSPLSTASPTFSPDSTEIAFCAPSLSVACAQIAVGPPTGPWRNVTVQPRGYTWSQLVWLADGKHLEALGYNNATDSMDLFTITLDGAPATATLPDTSWVAASGP